MLADLTRNTPEEFREALDGVSRCRRTSPPGTSRSTRCCSNLGKVSSVLDERDEDIIALMRDSDVLFRAVVARREAVHDLLVSTSQLSRELTAAGAGRAAPTSSRR